MQYKWFLVREKYRAHFADQVFEIPVWARSESEAVEKFRCFYPNATNATAEETDQEKAEARWQKIR